MGWVFPFGPEELQVFLQEADEQLQTLESGLLDLERDGVSAELLAAIFRAAHTLKGSAGTIGHEAMTRLTHAMEGVLDGLRSGRVAPTPELADRLLDAVDLLGRIRRSIATGADDDVDVEAAVRSLESTGSGSGPARQPVESRPAGAPPGEPQSDGGARWVAAVHLNTDAQMPAIRAYQAFVAAQGCGRVVESRPSLVEIESERVGDRVDLLVAGCDPEGLERALRAVPDVLDVRIEAVEDSAAPAAAPRTQQTVRVDVMVLDNLLNLVGELVIDRTRLSQVIGRLENAREEVQQELAQVSAHLRRITTQLQEEVMRSRLLPVQNLFRKFPRLVRDAAHQLSKEVDLVMVGQETELDRSVLEEIGDPLVHMLRNAVDHGVEAPEARQAAGKPPCGTITLTAEHRENRIVISVRDDGAGIDAAKLRQTAVERGVLTEEAARRLSGEDALDLIFSSGFTTKSEVTAISGRGVGMDVVRKNIERLNGSVFVSTELGRGTCITINLPLTLAIVRALLVRVADTVFALPLHTVVETVQLDAGCLSTIQGREVARVRGRVLPLVRGARLLGPDVDGTPPIGRPLVHLMAGSQPVALLVDALVGEGEVVIKALDRRLGALPGIAGATILGDGRVALILDPTGLQRAIEGDPSRKEGGRVA